MFGTEEGIAREYWHALSAVTSQILKEDPYKKPWKAHKEAKQSIKQVIKKYDPYAINDDIKGTTKSKKDQFLDWLTPENRKLAESVKKQYEFRLRNYLNIIRKTEYKNKYSAFPNL